MANSELTELLASYVPRLIQNRVAQNPAPIDTPLARDFLAAVMFADISGFTALTERLAEKGTAGVEKLARILNDYFGQLIDVVYEHGGDVVKFGGDAVIVVWPIRSHSASEEVQRQQTVRAVECAFKVREQLLNYQAEGSTLSLKFSLGTGRVWESHIGGVFNRWEFVLVGAPLVEIGAANEHAKAGDIIASPSAWELIKEDCEAETFRFETELGQSAGIAARLRKLKVNSQPMMDLSETELKFDDAAQVAFRPYIPGAIIHRISAGQSDWLAELRKVTILFINLPQMSHNTSLEAAHDVMRLIQQLVYRHEGSINKISQDDKGVMIDAALGLPPLTHTNDPLRGIQTAIMIRDELKARGLRGAIGVTTGRVFCGLIGTNYRREYTFLGNSVNLAGRLMSLALQQTQILERDGISILCDRTTYESTKERAEFEALPPHKMKGRSELVEVFHPLREKKGAVRAPTELIGRRAEKSLLVNAIQELQRGMPFQAIVLHGEAGIGKSRLMDELVHQAETSQVNVFSGVADALERNNPYYAWRAVFHHLLGLEELTVSPQRSEQSRLQIRDQVLAQLQEVDPELSRYVPLLNVVLPVSIPENDFTSGMTGEVRGGNIREVLVRLLQHQADQTPLLVTLEDLHWLDSASWALLSDVARRVRPLLLAVNTRPYSPPVPQQFKELAEGAGTTFIRLDTMPLDEVEELVCQRLGVKSIPPPAGRLIREKSEGHPFFAEELAYALRDSGILIIERDECRLAPGLNNLDSVSIPGNLEAAITSRIDSLDPSQQLTLKVASVIGRLFAFRVLEAIHPIETDKPALNQHLDTLTRMSLTLIESSASDLSYLFKHAITQEVAYNLMLFSQRRQLHQAVAEWYEKAFAKDLAAFYPILAHHWLIASETAPEDRTAQKAIEYLEKAGEAALRNYANQESVEYFSKLLSMVTPEKAQRFSLSDLKLAQWEQGLGEAHNRLGHLAECEEHFSRSLRYLNWPLPDTTGRLASSVTRQITQQTRIRLKRKENTADPSLTDEELEARRLACKILERLGLLYFIQNNAGMMIYCPLASLNLAEEIGPSPELAIAYSYVTGAAGLIPLHRLASLYEGLSLQTAEQVNNSLIEARVLMATSVYSAGTGRLEETEERLRQAIAAFEEGRVWEWWGVCLEMLTRVKYYQGKIQHSAELADRLYAAAKQQHDIVQQSWSLTSRMETHLLLADREDVLALAKELEGLVMESNEPGPRQKFYGVSAQVHLARGEWTAADENARKLLDLISAERPTSFGLLTTYIAAADTYLSLWERRALPDSNYLKQQAIQACKQLTRYAQILPIGEAARLRMHGVLAWLSGRRRQALKLWSQSLTRAQDLHMPLDEALAHYELGRHHPADDPARRVHLERAMQLLQQMGVSYFDSRMQEAWENTRFNDT